MILFTTVFGILSGCLLSVLVGIIGSRRGIGFTWAFLLSLIFTPLVGLILTLLSAPRSGEEAHWGCGGFVVALLGTICLVVFLILLFGASALVL